jgi:hypothetical protein
LVFATDKHIFHESTLKTDCTKDDRFEMQS